MDLESTDSLREMNMRSFPLESTTSLSKSVASRRLARLLSLAIDGKVWFPLLALATLGWRSAPPLLLLTVLGVLIELPLKVYIGRDRPRWSPSVSHGRLPKWTQPLLRAEAFSCPSGHTLRATLLTLWSGGHGDPPLPLPLLYVPLLLTAMSRVVLGRHYLGDVVAGIVAGILLYGCAASVASWL